MRIKRFFYRLPGKDLSFVRARSLAEAKRMVKYSLGVNKLPKGCTVWAEKNDYQSSLIMNQWT